ncbi:acyl-CoA dehydrogenase family protein [Aquabacterium humicola]|uniref:acyl-CoA dehydrogenase family protein n=1 Tax=Aquabacterium humicola TaxID=3237377 RepID=UPI00254277E9|nr:acyl-CoA dehydrogenase family protein [Rubrivivax pictus]
MHATLAELLHTPPAGASAPFDDLAAWWPHWQALQSTADSPVALALRCGWAADRIGWAFAGGYQAALRALLPSLAGERLAALCVTEAGGNRPRDIATRIAPQPDGMLRIDGEKRWTTLGPQSATLLVVGAWSPAGAEPAGRPALRVVRVESATPGVQLQPMPPTRFVPEVPHAGVLLTDVRVSASALLPGDGYEAVVKPFRTVEDVHVMLAIGAWLLREARARAWPSAFAERLVAALALLAELAAAETLAATTHVALAGALQWLAPLFAEAGERFAAAGDAVAARWPRDAALLQVAGAARAQRAARAWERLGG